MYDKDNQILVNEVRDLRKEVLRIKQKLNTLEVTVWVNIFLTFVIICAIAVLIINGSNNR